MCESDLNALLSSINVAEQVVIGKTQRLLDLQHEYLKRVGFTIDKAQGGFPGDLVYRRGNDTFLDVDRAMESAEE